MAEPPQFEFAEPLEPVKDRETIWDRFGLWTALAIVLIVIAYAYPIYSLLKMHRFGSAGFQPF